MTTTINCLKSNLHVFGIIRTNAKLFFFIKAATNVTMTQILKRLSKTLSLWLLTIMITCPCNLYTIAAHLLAHLSRRLRGEIMVYRSSRRPSVRAFVCVSTLSNMNISETNGSITTKFYRKRHWNGGLGALGFGPDWIRILVSMATFSRLFCIRSLSYLQVMMACMRARTSSKFCRIGPLTAE